MFKRFNSWLLSFNEKSLLALRKKVAEFWVYGYRGKFWLTTKTQKYGGAVAAVALFSVLAGSFYASPALQKILANYYSSAAEIESLRALILNIGSALIGAAAIVTSLVLFAMQVNIERMPHGLFRRLSADRKLY